MIKRRRQSRVAVAACHNFGVSPDAETDLSECATVLLGCATCKENSRAIDLLWQFSKDDPQTVGRGEPKIRWRQFSLLENAKFRTRCVGYYLNQCPGGFRSAAFNPEDALNGFHDLLCLAASRAI